jgi:cytochrome P450
MEFAFEFWFFLVGFVSLLLYLAWFVPKAKFQPPGPFNFPIVGSLFYLSKLPHRSMNELAKKYGPIMYLRLGYIDHIVISNGEMAKEVLKVHDADFGSRPRFIIGKDASFDWSDISLSPCGDYWRLLRKICSTEFLTQARLNNFQCERQDEVAYMVEEITKHNQGRPQLVEMRPIFHEFTSNNICRMMFGARRKELKNHLGNNFDDLFNSISDMVEIFNKFNISDLIPILKPFDLQGLERRMKCIRNRLENNLSNILKEYRKGNKLVFDSTVKYFIQVLLNLDKKLDDTSIMAILVNMIGGGTDTTAVTLEWALSELVHHPEMMERAQDELDKVVGKQRPVLESDFANLPYLQAIIKENFRLHPAGRRQCPGLNLGQLMVQCGLATILHAFDWSPPPNVKPKDMNMIEASGLATPLVEPLVVIAKPRLPPQVYKPSI